MDINSLLSFFQHKLSQGFTSEILVGSFALFFSLILFIILSLAGKQRSLKQQLTERDLQLTQAQQSLTELEKANTKHKIRNIRLITFLKNERKHAREKLELLEKAREELRLQFSDLAQQIFDEKSEKFSSQSKEKLEAILNPFNLQMNSLKKEINDIYLNDTRERASLRKEILQLRELNQQINEEAINLTKALKGSSKVQGNWGELVLERVLEQSGLRQGHEYDIQKGFKDRDDKLFKPDVIIHLPEGKDIIVDSKVSLTSWEKYCSAETDQKKEQHLGELTRAVRDHITDLANKKYWELQGIQSLDFILMFMPIEAAFIAAFQHDDRLFNEAFAGKIVVVTPTTLLATLRTIENIWQYEHQSRNSLEIARRAGFMYDKFRGFIEDMEKIGRQLEGCRLGYDSAMNKLTLGKGNLVAQAGMLTELGVQVKKELPRTLTALQDAEASDDAERGLFDS